MPVRRVTFVCLPVGARSGVEFRRYRVRTPILTIRAGHPPAMVTLTLPERVEEGQVVFARQLARQAARYALEVERSWRSLQHIEHIYVKTGVSSRVEASLFAIKHGLLAPTPT